MKLEIISKTDSRLQELMKVHYNQPKGFVGRSICYAILYDGTFYGAIVAGSSTLHLPNRNEFFNICKSDLNHIVNNIFYHIEKINGKYPIRNFSVKVLQLWRDRVVQDWKTKYGDDVIGFESLVELPRTGEIYLRDGWIEIGLTKGYTCKRVAGMGTDSWTGKRVWNTTDLRPKRVFVKTSK